MVRPYVRYASSNCSMPVRTVHFGWKAGVPAYGLAAYVAGSRLQENRHYMSDVLFGAAVGIVSGRTVTIARTDVGILIGSGGETAELVQEAAEHIFVRR